MDATERELEHERTALLERLERGLEKPMIVLAFAWLGLLVADFVWGDAHLFRVFGTAIWAIFVVDFIIKFILAPHKGAYLRRNVVTVISLMLPALRIVRIVPIVRLLRVSRAVRSLRLLRVLGSVNRGMRALGAALSRRGFGYVAGLTLVVLLAGAAGMYAFENTGRDGALNDYGTALWWTAMVLTTMGSEFWPQTPEGRLLCFLLALYAFTVFGYVTATLATFFIGRDAEDDAAEIAGAQALNELHNEIALLRSEVMALSQRFTAR